MTNKTAYRFACSLLLMIAPARGQEALPRPAAAEESLRKAPAKSGSFLLADNIHAAVPASSTALAEALDLHPNQIGATSLSGPQSGAGVFTSLGVIRPKRGQSFALMSSGVAGASRPEPGTDFPPTGVQGDRVVLTLSLNLPAGTSRLSFDYSFLSTEYPEYVGTSFNDTFSTVLTDASGTREIARATVNSSKFYAVSAASAGGTGFDLFTPDPAGTDTDFPGGLPDAGITGWRSVSAAVRGGAPVTLQFSVEDVGDGLLDSAVILDNLTLSFLEIVDPNPALLSGGNIISDPVKLAQLGESVDAAAADGVTRILVRARVPGSGSVQFCLSGASAPQDGGLAPVGSSGRSDCANAQVQEISPSSFMAFCTYQTPDEFNRQGDEALSRRPITISARFFPPGAATLESSISLQLVRPPVLLVHGIWSESPTWTFGLMTDERFSVTAADYKGTNASYFGTNLGVVGAYIRDILTKFRLNRIAVTQVDIVGHSMGGLLGRNHVGLSTYKHNNNFNAGDIHKLITLNSPHTGSPLANFVNSIRAIPVIGGAFEWAASKLNHPVHQGAIDDLATGSAAINAIQRTEIPAHALVGIGGSSALTLAPGPLGHFYRTVNFFASVSDLFKGLQHDFVVGRKSQEGGMPSAATTVFPGLDSIHIFTNSSDNYSKRVIELLNRPGKDSVFSFFPAPATLPSSSEPEPARTLLKSEVAVSFTSGLVITAPISGATVQAGKAVRVVVQPSSGVVANRILLVGPEVALVDTAAPFEFDLEIPSDALGTFALAAVGSDAAGNFYSSNTVNLKVTTSASLTSAKLIPNNLLLFSIGEKQNVTVIGKFSDGILRDITSLATGTTYLSSDSGIITVSSDGLVTAKKAGTATVVARNGSVQDSINVSVIQNNLSPQANAGPDQYVFPNTLITLDGSKSSDPDNSPKALAFHWQQTAGSNVTLSGAAAAKPTFTATQAGTYVFSLVVNDGQDDSEPDSVTITVLPTQFADVPASYWAYNYIMAIYQAKITLGCGGGKFCPEDLVTREQMAAFIIRALEGDRPNSYCDSGTPYSDVPATNIQCGNIKRLYERGITKVVGSFDPKGVVTRGQMAAFMIRALYGDGFTYSAVPYFYDVPATHGFFKYVQKMKDTGLTKVTGEYFVDRNITRAEMAAFLARAFLGMQ